MSITRRNFLASVPPILTTVALPVIAEASVELPMQKMARLRQELIEATKQAYPEVGDWRVMNDPDDDKSRIVGFFMLLGHRPKGGRRDAS